MAMEFAALIFLVFKVGGKTCVTQILHFEDPPFGMGVGYLPDAASQILSLEQVCCRSMVNIISNMDRWNEYNNFVVQTSVGNQPCRDDKALSNACNTDSPRGRW